MRQAEANERRNLERRANAARRTIAFYCPRPQLLRDFTQESLSSKIKTKPSEDPVDGGFRGFIADAFFGASPVVASALGICLGATPRRRNHTNTHFRQLQAKGDISTLLARVTFLLCVDTNSEHPLFSNRLDVQLAPKGQKSIWVVTVYVT
jgi:hypothetical protein